MEPKLYVKQESRINGRGVWHYVIDTPIGELHVIDYEAKTGEVSRTIISGDVDKAERKYKAICKKIIME